MIHSETKPAKKPSVFIVKTHGAKDRLIRATNVGSVRQHLLGSLTISKATGDEVADAITDGVLVESAAKNTAAVAADTTE